MSTPDCPFCALQADPADRPLGPSNTLAFTLRDNYPVSPGHTLIITRRHVADWFDATADEQRALLDLAAATRDAPATPQPTGWNLGVNIGPSAGQTVPHLHVHLIPRYDGDVDDPRGGVRFVIPARGNYKRPGHIPHPGPTPPPLSTGGRADPFLRHIAPLFSRADQIDIVAAFVQSSGLDLLAPDLAVTLSRPDATVRLLTGDYLGFTQVEALRGLLDLQRASQLDPTTGRLHARVVPLTALGWRSFHPKAWIFASPTFGTAWVGSANLTATALTGGVEWSLSARRDTHPGAFAAIRDAFDLTWAQATDLTEPFIEGYAARVAARPPVHLPDWEQTPDDTPAPPEPRPIQLAALAALATSRAAGRQRALVVLATGLGKTWLAAFDVARATAARLPNPTRVLFLAHREELLRQAARTFRRVLPTATFGYFTGDLDLLDGSIVFASTQKLSRPANLARLAPHAFDYVIVDEAHHAAAATYRAILAHLSPTFVLGLTATPDRADAADILGLFDDHESFRLDLGEGIQRDALAPFRYAGVKDTIDFAPIPWRNGRFDPTTLTAAAATQARMATLLEALATYPGTRTLIFCCSIAHATWTRDQLASANIPTATCHSGPDADDRRDSLAALAEGHLQAITTVDLFNEGVDVPNIDRVVMLRPTESPTLFLQQLGRGLRLSPDKTHLQVIDFVGNHRVFLDRIRILLSLSAKPPTLRSYLAGAPLDLPSGCSVDLALEAKDLLTQLLPAPGTNALIARYHELKAARGERPTLGELYRLGYNPASLRKTHTSWLGFLADQSDLTPEEQAAYDSAPGWFITLEKTPMTKSFKLVLLEVLLDHNAFWYGMTLDQLARRSHARLLASPELLSDIPNLKALPDPTTPDPSFQAYWRKNPVAAWLGESSRKGTRPFFTLDPDASTFRFATPPPAAPTAQAFESLTRELLDYRMAVYRSRDPARAPTATSFTAKLSWNKRRPIIFLPSRTTLELPTGPTDVRLPDGSLWRFRFAKVAINVAHPVGRHDNRLPDLLRRWFGPHAGHPGTNHHLSFSLSPDGWWVAPIDAQPEHLAPIIPLTNRRPFQAFPTLRAAAGWQGDLTHHDAHEPEHVHLPITSPPTTTDPDPDLFAIRASGTSMDGWQHTIRDGDWLIMRWARAARAAALHDQIALIGRGHPDTGRTWHLKRVIKTNDNYTLHSDNPAFPPMPAGPTDDPVALLVETIRPESLAPAPRSTVPEDDLAATFGLSAAPDPPWSRIDGHLFILLEGRESLTAPDRLTHRVPKLRPAETAFVLGRPDPDTDWTYLGVASRRPDDGPETWVIPEVDFPAWRALGHGRSASRRLPEGAEARARQLVDDLLADLPENSWLEANGKRCRVLGRAPRGGLRIDGGPDGFAERTVSLTDLAWVLAAQDASGSVAEPDEAAVNRLRYLDGTPSAATRWIDSGWALVLAGS